MSKLLPTALLALLAASCSSMPAGKPIAKIAPEINATLTAASELVLAPGDVLDVRFTKLPDWNHTTQVRPDGKATFLALDDVHVAGLTLPQLDEKLTAAYDFLQQPELTVIVTELAARNVVVTGEVGNPGALRIESGRLTLVEAIGRAGGHNLSSANLSHTLLVRWLPEEQRQVSWSIDARPPNWGSAESILLQPYDVVYVPNTPITRVNIWVDQYVRRLIPLPLFYVN